MAFTNFLQSASSAVSSARKTIRTFDLQSGVEILDNQQISDLANNAIASATGFTPERLSSNIQNLSDKLSRVASPFTDALGSISASLPALSQSVSLINPALGNIVTPVQNILGAISSGSADQTLLGLFDPNANAPFTLGQGAGGAGEIILGNPTTDNFSSSRLANPLRNFSSHNYIISLGILTVSENNSPNATYRSSGLSKIILSSAGGNRNKRQTTATEDLYGPHGEYFIENLEIDSMITHNNTVGAANTTQITFSVIEPYSMGQFLEACAAAALSIPGTTYDNWTMAPFCLEIKFVGYDTSGNELEAGISPKYVPFMFTDIQFDVNGSGSTYSIEAIPYNEQTTIDQIQEVKTDSNLRGSTVAELLQTNPFNSLTNVMNSRIETQEDAGAISRGDRYIICFPPEGKDIQEAVDDATARFQQTGSTGATAPTTVDTSSLAGITAASSASGGGLYESLKAWANNPANISSIGNARIVLDINEEGDRPSAFADLSIDVGNALRPVQRNAESTQMTDTERNFQLTQGTRIMDTIADAIVQSEYGRAIIDGPSETGQYQWYKVDLKTYIEFDRSTTGQTGTNPNVYVYQVKPFLADESFFQGPSRRSNSTAILKQNALKTYNYLYTGKNEDVLDFNIEYKMAFFEAMAADLGQLSGPQNSVAANETINNGPPVPTGRADIGALGGTPDNPNEAHVRQLETISNGGNSAAGRRLGQTDANKIRVAEMFNEALTNSITDLINADLTIWGDPYFIPDSGMGNFTDQSVPGAPGVTTGGTIETLGQETFIIVNFRLPYDYDPSTGLMTFSKVQRHFSGLYEVITVLNSFKDGVFTQTLRVMRRRSQSDEGTGDTPMIREDPSVDLSEGLNGHQGPGGPIGGQDVDRSLDSGSGQGGVGGTGASASPSNPNVVASGPPTGNTPPNVSYNPLFNARTRNQAIQPQLLNILQTAAEAAGVRVEIWSGGQDVYPNGRRTGSRRHDAGYAADVDLYDGDRRLRVNDPEELAIVQTFIRAARDAGATGIGAGNGYMGDERYHIDIAKGNSLPPGHSTENVRSWGTPDARSAGAPAWLRDIMG